MIAHGYNSRTYVLMQYSRKREQMSTISRCKKIQISASTFEDQRLEQTDFAVIHSSPSIGAVPSIVLFLKILTWWIVRQGFVLEGRH